MMNYSFNLSSSFRLGRKYRSQKREKNTAKIDMELDYPPSFSSIQGLQSRAWTPSSILKNDV